MQAHTVILRPDAAAASALVATPYTLEPATGADESGAVADGALVEHSDLRSERSEAETFVVFSNESSHVVDLCWVDYAGSEVFYGSVDPGMSFRQHTFASHPWVVRDQLSQHLMLTLVATSQQLVAVLRSVATTTEASVLVATPLRPDAATGADEAGAGAGGALVEHSGLRSETSDTETFVVLSNVSSHVVDFWWVDYAGSEVFYESVDPGMSFLQHTFASHPWVVRDQTSRNAVLTLVATAQPVMAVVQSWCGSE